MEKIQEAVNQLQDKEKQESQKKSEKFLKPEESYDETTQKSDSIMNMQEPSKTNIQIDPEDQQALRKMGQVAYEMGQNVDIVLQDPTEYVLMLTQQIWSERRNKLPSNTIKVIIRKPSLQKNIYSQIFLLMPSIQLIVGEQKIINNSIHREEGDRIIEGTDTFMIIHYRELDSYYKGEVKDCKQHGTGIYVYQSSKKTGYTYQGSFLDGKREGYGEQKTNRHQVYKGQWQNDYKHGEGTEIQFSRKKCKDSEKGIKIVEKFIYVGQFTEGMREGKGVEKGPNGTYDGIWREGFKHGKGIMTYKNEDKYEGEWYDGQLSGEGTYHENSGNIYSGEFKEGDYNGKGEMKYENGDTFVGEWLSGKRHGQGNYTWSDQDYYQGDWVKGFAQGNGVSMIKDVYYEGEYNLGMKNGLGEETDPDGNTIKGIWEKGELRRKIMENGEEVPEEEQDVLKKDITH